MVYPEGIDCVWLATDAQGRVAAMITAGCGPIPPRALSGDVDILTMEERLLGLPVTGDAILHCDVPNPSSFVALGSRGLFVYDWTDVHRSNAGATAHYELVAGPLMPITLGQVPEELGRAAIAFADATFGSARLKV